MGEFANKLAAQNPAFQRAYLGSLTSSLVKSGKLETYYQTLTDFDFLVVKVKHPEFGVQALIEDYDLIDEWADIDHPEYNSEKIKIIKLIQAALQLSAHIVAVDQNQLASQLHGHLLDKKIPVVQALLIKSKQQTITPWLCPLTANLISADSSLLRTLTGHTASVNVVAITPDGKQVISASSDKTIKVWNLAKGKELVTLTGHKGGVTAIAVTPDGKQVISGSFDQTLKVWNLAEAKELFTLDGHEDRINAITITPDGLKIISASDDKTLKVWELQTGKPLFTFRKHTGGINDIAITPDGLRVVSASYDQTLKVWNLETGQEILSFKRHISSVVKVVISPDDQKVISISSNNHIKFWDLETGIQLHTLYHNPKDSIIAVIYSYNQPSVVYTSPDNTLTIWKLETDEKISIPIEYSSPINSIVVTHDSKKIIAAFDDTTLKAYNLEIRKQKLTPIGHSNSVNAVDITPDGKQVISASSDKTIKVWSLETKAELYTVNCHYASVNSVVITPNGKEVISVSDDDTVKVWNLALQQQNNSGIAKPSFWIITSVKAVAVTPNSKHLITANNDRTFAVWDLETRKKVFNFPETKREFSQELKIFYSPTEQTITLRQKDDCQPTSDGKWWILISKTGKNIKVMENATKKEVLSLTIDNRVKEITLNSNGMLEISKVYQPKILPKSDFDVIMWNNFLWNLPPLVIKYLKTGETIEINKTGFVITSDDEWLIKVKYPHKITIYKIGNQFSIFPINSIDANVKILFLNSQGKLMNFPGHTNSINAVAITPNGTQAISASSDTNLKVWNLLTGKEKLTLTEHSHVVKAVVVTPNSKKLISGSFDKTIKVWNLENGEELFTLCGHTGRVQAVAVTPDGKHVISASDDNTLKVWNLELRKVLTTYIGDSSINCCAVAPDGVTIVAGDSSGRVHFLRLEGMER
ncbi:WD40 repeat domain-containing protein [Nostoc sp. FACHB-280]|uniref:WD40 repeat domain-containing protein n=1 Tax=Nostoc sp. FACHB-280 TaxID=2692839 RepID=UPI00168B8945|nr:WD40 repeat domain-containing protein [Nostoc sp. FACHB-280]MBD2492862.1 WD40 repeat domain-containing protein [Nostoc sp. FACHB-280]